MTTQSLIGDLMFPQGLRVRVNAPGDARLDEGWHEGTVAYTYDGKHMTMVMIDFDDPQVGQRAIAGPYVRRTS